MSRLALEGSVSDISGMSFAKWINPLFAAVLLCGTLSNSAQAGQVTVFAAASLKEALDDVVTRFHAETGHSVVTSFAGSSLLARQIEQGAPADIFVSASSDWMDVLETSGAIRAETRVDLLSNHLVLVGSQARVDVDTITPQTDLITMLGGGRLAMALTTSVPAGIYGKAALETLGLWNDVAASVAETDNVRTALALVALGAAPFGIVYATDAKAEKRVDIVGIFPTQTHPEIIYPAAIVSRSTSPTAATFLDYLRSDTAHDVFEDHGFIVIAE